MASINLTGVLRDPTGEFAYKNKIQFTHASTTGQTPKGFRSLTVIGEDGSYDINVEYGNVFVQTWDNLNHVWINHGTLTINSDTPATDIPSLLGITTPATDADLLVFQALVADATSAKNDAETAQAATEDLFTGFTDSVADSLATVSPANIDWDVEISFNDSGEMEKGFGNRNTYGNKTVDFSRASTSGNINKSGALETLAVDEIAIESSGAGFYQSFRNELFYSQDFTNSAWNKTSATVIESTTELSILTDKTYCYEIFEDSSLAQHSIGQLAVALNSNNSVCLRFCVKDNNSNREIHIAVEGIAGLIYAMRFDPSDGSVTDAGNITKYNVRSLGDGWYEYAIKVPVSDDDLNVTQAKLALYNGDLSYTGDGTSKIFVDYAQLTSDVCISHAPYIKTEATAVTRSADICSIPMMGNMPATGQPFTIMLDSVVEYNDDFKSIFKSDDSMLLLQIRNDGTLGVSVSGGIDRLGYNDKVGIIGSTRFIVSYDGSDLNLYVNGLLVASGSKTAAYSTSATSLYIGREASGVHVNSTIKNFRIKHSALSALQVAALGSVE